MRLPTHLIDFRHRPRRGLAFGITISLLLHGLILSLQFGELGLALPGVELPWSERRAQTPELTVTLANVLPQSIAAAPASSDAHSISPEPVKSAATPESKPAESMKMVPPATPEKRPPTGLVLQPLATITEVAPAPETPKPTIKQSKAHRKAITPPKPASSPQQAETVQAEVRPPIIAKTKTSDDPFVVDTPSPDDPQPPTSSKAATAEPAAKTTSPAEPVTPLPTNDAQAVARQQAEGEKERAADREQQAQQAQAEEQRKKAERDAQVKFSQADAARRDEAARRQAAAIALQNEMLAAQTREQDDAARRAMVLEAMQLEAKQREEMKRQLEAKAAREAIELDTQKRAEAKRLQAIEAERLKQAQEIAASAQAEANRRKVAAEADAAANRQKAEADAAANAQQKELARIAGEKAAAAAAATAAANAAAARGNESRSLERGSLAGVAGTGDLASRALSQARNLDLFSAKPSPSAPPSSALSSGSESSRRRSIFGSKDRDIGLRMYIDNWRLKIERNGRLNYAQSSIAKSRGDPVVTVAVRSDGSIEDITINRSSGRPELDEAVRRIVRLNARFSAFPPALASQYDVIEIHHVWNFDETLRLLDEVQ